MSDIRAITRIQDADDVVAPTGADDGKVWAWNVAQQKFIPTTLNYEPAGAVAAHVALADPHTQYELESANTAIAILTKLFTVDGSGSGLDADLLRGVTPSAYFLTLADDADASTARTTLGLGTLATANVPGSTGQVIYNSAGALAGDAGLTYDDANDALTVSGRVVTGVIRPAADSTAAVQVQTAAGTAVITVDTASNAEGRIAIGGISTNFSADAGGTVIGPAVLTLKNENDVADAFNMVDSSEKFIFQLNRFGNLGLFRHTVNGIAAGFNVRRDRGGAKMEENDQIFLMSALPYDGVAYRATATIRAIIDGPTTTDVAVPTGWAILTGPFKSGVERVRISSVGYTGFWLTVPTALVDIAASDNTRASLRIRTGTAPTTPNDGDLWYDGRLRFRRSSTTEIIPTAAQQSAYTQTYSTAARTVNAYTSDAESSAYTGIDNAQAGTVYAQLSDLNNLRVAYENLRAMADNLIQVVNALIDDGQAFGMT